VFGLAEGDYIECFMSMVVLGMKQRWGELKPLGSYQQRADVYQKFKFFDGFEYHHLHTSTQFRPFSDGVFPNERSAQRAEVATTKTTDFMV